MDLAAKLVWEVLPISLAFAVIFYCGFRALVTNNKNVLRDSAMSMIAAAIMMAAQVSWTWTVFIKNDLLGTEAANILWTLFNSIVMLKFLYTAYWNRDA